MEGQEKERPIRNEYWEHRQASDGHMHGENEGDCLLDIVEDAPAKTDGCNDRREIIVQEHKGCGLSGDVGSATSHGDADVGCFQGRGIVHPITGHGDDLLVCLQGIDDAQFLFWNHAGKDLDVAELSCQFFIRHSVEFGPGDNPVGVRNSRLPGYVLGGRGIVTRYHHDAHASGLALGDRRGHLRSHRVLETKQSDELQRQTMMLLG